MAATQPRRAPTQRRSRERLERILAVARELISEQGSDAMRMGELAARAGISIGSLYQYFPDKTAVIRGLAERINARGRVCIEAELAAARDPAGMASAFARLVDIYYALFLAEPVMRDIWAATQADRGLQAFELEESRANGAILAAAMVRLRPDEDPAALATAGFLIMQLGEATMRIALAVGRDEGSRLVEIYKRLALKEIAPP